MNWADWGEILVACVFGSLRIGGVKSKSFQAFAHLYVGGLFGAWMASGVTFFLWLAVALSIVELLCFLFSLYKVWFKGLS